MKNFRRLIAMGLAASFLSLFGCTEKEAKSMSAEGGKIMSLSISEMQMNFNNSYSFEIREEDDGTVYFYADFLQNEDGNRIVIEDCEVDKKYIEKLRKIAEKNGVVEYVKTYQVPEINEYALDAPSYSTSISMSDGSSKTVGLLCDGNAELKSFFTKLAKKYDGADS